MNDAELIMALYDILYAAPELNMSNYSEEEVEELNEAVIQACGLLFEHLKDG